MRSVTRFQLLRLAGVAASVVAFGATWLFASPGIEPSADPAPAFLVVALVHSATLFILVRLVWNRSNESLGRGRLVLSIWYFVGAAFGAAVAGLLARSGYPIIVTIGMALGAIGLAVTADWCLAEWDRRSAARIEIAVFLVGTHILALLVVTAAISLRLATSDRIDSLVGNGVFALTWLAIPVCAGMVVRLRLTSPDTKNVTLADTSAVSGSTVLLSSLTPLYAPTQHEVYVDALRDALTDGHHVRNIALAGPYGTGKSSILSRVAGDFQPQVLQISLLTLGSEPSSSDSADSINNRIQKEVVKQLLYQRRPTNAPQSRFRRIIRFRWTHELPVALMVAAAVVVVALVAGLRVSVSPSFALTLSDGHMGGANFVFYVLLAAVVGGLVVVLRAFSRGRIGIDKVTAGPATITLPARSESYFDEYLDEIIYLFESDPQKDIVIIEDLDRFDDHTIYEALRSLNGLLNSAQQLDGRNIRFIYAVRDSVFEQAGGHNGAVGDESEFVRSDRTKFFDLIVPVVPFITHKNARDLMMAELNNRGYVIAPDLVDLAARHVADMRLIRNIVNEYGIFKNRLLDVDTPVPGLDHDRLFAMMLFKNAHMKQFELIRHGDSALDLLWEVGRAFINANVDTLRSGIREARNQLARTVARGEHAKAVAKALLDRIATLKNAPGSPLLSSAPQLRGAALSREELEDPEFWETFIAEEQSLTVQVQGYYSTQFLELNRVTIEALTGMTLDVAKVLGVAEAELNERIAVNVRAIRELSRASWLDLAASAYRYQLPGADDSRSFAEIAEHLLPSQFAADLVVNGYITSYYSLHVSSFYGTAIGPNAMTYILKYVDLRRSEAEYELSADDVEAILRDQGVTVLTERSMFNVSVLDHLIAHRPADARTLMERIASAGQEGVEFITRYLESGSSKAELVAAVAPRMKDILTIVTESPALSDEEKVALIDSALAATGLDVIFAIPDELVGLIEHNPQALISLRGRATAKQSLRIVRFLDEAGATITGLDELSAAARVALRSTSAYAISEENLAILTSSSDVSLDVLHSTDPQMFTYASEHPRAYVTALGESKATPHSVSSSELLVQFLKVAGGADVAASTEVIRRAAPGCLVPRLAKVPKASWAALVEAAKVPLTFGNVSAYVDDTGHVDGVLSGALAKVDRVVTPDDTPDEDRHELAKAIANALGDVLTSSQRVRLMLSIGPNPMSATNIEPRAGTLIGDLLNAGLISDDEDAFSARLMVDWPTQAHAIKHSSSFSELIGPGTLAPEHLASVLEDTELDSLHRAVAGAFKSYPSVPREAWTAFVRRGLSKRAGFVPTASGLQGAAGAGVDPSLLLKALVAARDAMTLDGLRTVLRAMGEPWATVADPGYAIRDISISPESRQVLTWLQEADIVSKFPEVGGEFHVTLRRR